MTTPLEWIKNKVLNKTLKKGQKKIRKLRKKDKLTETDRSEIIAALLTLQKDTFDITIKNNKGKEELINEHNLKNQKNKELLNLLEEVIEELKGITG